MRFFYRRTYPVTVKAFCDDVLHAIFMRLYLFVLWYARGKKDICRFCGHHMSEHDGECPLDDLQWDWKK